MDRSWPFMFEGMAAFRRTSKALPPPPVPPFALRTATGSGLADVNPDLSRYEFRSTNYFRYICKFSSLVSVDKSRNSASSKLNMFALHFLFY